MNRSSSITDSQIDVWLRKWGLVLALDKNKNEIQLIHTRIEDTEEALDSLTGLIDGPPSEEVLQKLKLSYRSHEEYRLGIEYQEHPDATYPSSTQAARQVDKMRRIPAKRGEISDPYILEPGPEAEENKISLVTFEKLPVNWKPIAYTWVSGTSEKSPILISDGKRLVSGFPIMELLYSKMTMPVCPEGYYSSLQSPMNWEFEYWLINQILEHSQNAGLTVLQQKHWPTGFEAAFTVRHDYDRPIDEDVMKDLLNFYKQKGIKCSVGFLDRLQVLHDIKAIIKGGHEIVLHSEAADEKEFSSEISSLRNLGMTLGFKVAGATCHGGIGSAGHLGATLFDWSSRSNLTYTEQLGRDALLPHPVLSGKESKKSKKSEVMIVTAHHSLDFGTAPHAHHLHHLAREFPKRFAAGGLVTLMNHPDIHVDQVKILLEWLNLELVWCATHQAIIDWCDITKYSSTITCDGENINLKFQRAIPHDLTIDVYGPLDYPDIIIPKGTTSWQISLPSQNNENVLERNSSKMRRMEFKRLEYIASSFRNSIDVPKFKQPKTNSEHIIMSFIKKIKHKGISLFRALKPRKDLEEKTKPKTIGLEQPFRCAIVARTMREAEAAEKVLRGTSGIFRYPPLHIEYYSTVSGSIGLPTDSSQPASFFHTKNKDLFDLVYVDPSVKIFDTPYGKTLISKVNSLATDRGTIVLPDWTKQSDSGSFSEEKLNYLFASDVRRSSNNLLCYSKNAAMSDFSSVLSWYMSNGVDLVLEEIRFRSGIIGLSAYLQDPLIDEILLDSTTVAQGEVRGARSGEQNLDLNSMMNDTVMSHAYLIGGVSYKSALISYIINQHLPEDRQKLRYADIGGGYGALVAEVLASSDKERFEYGVTRDIASQNIFLSHSLYANLRKILSGRFKFSLGPAEDFAYEDGYDIISFVGSLLYVEKSRLSDVLDRVWSCIKPGGVLIIHENIKNESFTRDFDVMFEAKELDHLLGKYGNINYYNSQAYLTFKAEQVENKTVFRVVQKK